MNVVRCLLISLLMILPGCAELPLVRQIPEVSRTVPYRLQLQFNSALSEPFYVLAGPMETYDRFPVNAALAELLALTLERQQAPGSVLVAVVEVRISSLTPNYDQFGRRNPGGYGTVAPVRAGDAARWVTRDADGDGTDVPEETHRGAVLQGEMRILVDGRELRRQSLEISDQEVLNRHDFYPLVPAYRERFDFRPVLERVLLKTAAEVSRVTAETLGQSS